MDQAVRKTTLKNGVRIITKRMPYIHSVSMGVWVNVGVRDESSNENGLSHFIEHMIFKGTKKRSSFQIAKEFDAIGGHTTLLPVPRIPVIMQRLWGHTWKPWSTFFPTSF